MSVITIPVSDVQKSFIEQMVKSGRAATKAHAVRMAIDLMAREEAIASIQRARREIRNGKGLEGNLEKLSKLID